MTIQDGMDSALIVVVIQRAETRTPMTMMAVVTGDELDLAPLLPRRWPMLRRCSRIIFLI
jgi:hypothetical protein